MSKLTDTEAKTVYREAIEPASDDEGAAWWAEVSQLSWLTAKRFGR